MEREANFCRHEVGFGNRGDIEQTLLSLRIGQAHLAAALLEFPGGRVGKFGHGLGGGKKTAASSPGTFIEKTAS
ncbi:MAG: hypothetical protein R6V33_12165 [Pelovirga sp.]